MAGSKSEFDCALLRAALTCDEQVHAAAGCVNGRARTVGRVRERRARASVRRPCVYDGWYYGIEGLSCVHSEMVVVYLMTPQKVAALILII